MASFMDCADGDIVRFYVGGAAGGEQTEIAKIRKEI